MPRLVQLAIFVSTLAAIANAQEPGQPQPLNIVTREVEPFVIQHEAGDWSGIAIDLWDSLASDLGVEYTIQARELEEMISDVSGGRADLAVGALTITLDREERLDFSHPFYTTGLGIAVRSEGRMLWRLLRAIFSWEFATAITSLLTILFIAGAGVWVFERHRNREQFGGSRVAGLGDGLWWAAVTMTTVGYGDKAPITFGGRVVALIWMYASVIIISFFTAGIATSLTVGSLQSGIAGPRDLRGVAVGVVGGSTGEDFAVQYDADTRRYESVSEAVEALASGELDAVVYDKPLLAYAMEESGADALLLEGIWERQSYAFAMPEGSPLREHLNQALLSALESPAWAETLDRYLDFE